MDDLISRQAAIDAINEIIRMEHSLSPKVYVAKDAIKRLPSAQREIVWCKDCKNWNNGSCECREHAVNSQDYYVGDMETEAEHFCGYAEMREVTT